MGPDNTTQSWNVFDEVLRELGPHLEQLPTFEAGIPVPDNRTTYTFGLQHRGNSQRHNVYGCNQTDETDLRILDYNHTTTSGVNPSDYLIPADSFDQFLDPDIIPLWDGTEQQPVRKLCRRGGKRPRPIGQSSNNSRSSKASNVPLRKKSRFSEFQTDILKAWLSCNLSDPYPDTKTKENLAKAAGLSVQQVRQWFSRTRKRKLTRIEPRDAQATFSIDRHEPDHSTRTGTSLSAKHLSVQNRLGMHMGSLINQSMEKQVLGSKTSNTWGGIWPISRPHSFRSDLVATIASLTLPRRSQSCPAKFSSSRYFEHELRPPHGSSYSPLATNGKSSLQVGHASYHNGCDLASTSGHSSWRGEDDDNPSQCLHWNAHCWGIEWWLDLLPAEAAEFEETAEPTIDTPQLSEFENLVRGEQVNTSHQCESSEEAHCSPMSNFEELRLADKQLLNGLPNIDLSHLQCSRGRPLGINTGNATTQTSSPVDRIPENEFPTHLDIVNLNIDKLEEHPRVVSSPGSTSSSFASFRRFSQRLINACCSSVGTTDDGSDNGPRAATTDEGSDNGPRAGSSIGSVWSFVSRGSRKGRRGVYEQSTTSSAVGNETDWHARDLEPESRFYQCAFCNKEFATKFTWRRHEEAVHIEARKWICEPTTFRVPADECPGCRLNTSLALGDFSGGCPHRFESCWAKPEAERTFFRKDALAQHVRGVHATYGSMTLLYGYGGCEVPVLEENLICPFEFCREWNASWSARVDHVAEHFQRGESLHKERRFQEMTAREPLSYT